MEKVLSVEDLCIWKEGSPERPIVSNVSFDLGRGEILGLVGESGSGKTLTAISLIGLLPTGLRYSGRSMVAGETADGAGVQVERRRGKRITMIFQNPMTAFNPFFRIEQHFFDACKAHRHMREAEATAIACETLRDVGLPTPEVLLKKYPHQMSGGQLQRVAIALALACDPQVLIADEPTTALDVTVQAQIVGLLLTLARSRGLSILFITHDLALVNALCDRVMVLRSGMVCEVGDKTSLLRSPTHPYTQSLLDAVP